MKTQRAFCKMAIRVIGMAVMLSSAAVATRLWQAAAREEESWWLTAPLTVVLGVICGAGYRTVRETFED